MSICFLDLLNVYTIATYTFSKFNELDIHIFPFPPPNKLFFIYNVLLLLHPFVHCRRALFAGRRGPMTTIVNSSTTTPTSTLSRTLTLATRTSGKNCW